MITTLSNFAKKDLFSVPSRFWIGVVSIAIGTALSLVFLVVINTLFTISTEKAVSGIDANEITIKPKYSVGFLRVTKSEQRSIDQQAIEEVQKLPNITGVRVEGVVQYPTSLEVSIFDTRFESDTPVYGIDDALFESITTKKLSNANNVPVLISRQLIDIYNLGIAQAIRKPQLNEDFLRGFSFDLKLGYSSFFRNETKEKIELKKAEVVGISDGIPIVGITLPLSKVEAINKQFLGDNFQPYYTKAYAKMTDPKYFESLKKQINAMGFEAVSFQEQIQPITNQLSYVSFVLFAIIFLMVIVILLNIFFLFYSQFIEKRYVIAILKTIGGYWKDILLLFFRQALMVGVVGVIIGLSMGVLTIFIGNFIIETNFSYLKESVGVLLSLEWWHVVMVGLLMLLLTEMAVLYPAIMASRLLPKEVLAES